MFPNEPISSVYNHKELIALIDYLFAIVLLRGINSKVFLINCPWLPVETLSLVGKERKRNDVVFGPKIICVGTRKPSGGTHQKF